MGLNGESGTKLAIDRVRARIQVACTRAGRSAADVTLIAVTKTVGADAYASLLRAGVRDVGENRALDAVAKAVEAPPGMVWHLIGHLQTNKARKAARLFHFIHSVDSLRLAETLQRELELAGRTMEAFVEVNSGESEKEGMPPGDVAAFMERVRPLDRLRWSGLMTMAPFSDDRETSRPAFRRLRELSAGLRASAGHLGPGLSMGMSGDFETAIEEGATHVRIGRAIFPA